jgi:hypothetical protein
MPNSFVEAYHDLLREEIESLLERSKDQERRFAEISGERQQLVSAVRQLDEHIDELYSNESRLAQAVEQQVDQIKHLESSVNRLAEVVLAITNKPQSTLAARLGGVLYWLGTGLAVLLLLGGIWLFYEVFRSQTREAVAWLLPIAVVILGSIAWLVGRAFCYVFAGR